MFWKIYLYILGFFVVLYHYAVGFSRIWEYIHLIFHIGAIVAVIGFCWAQPILNRLFWRIFMPIFVVYEWVYCNYIPEPQSVSNTPSLESYNNIAVTIPLGLFYIFALLLCYVLFVYAYRNRDIWGL